ncbi:hypothetical protein [Chamaesiphon sp. VAR_48_metabat_135_sub]|nr:hypothetical protein [Chamaesiphon sp. VAR_48_metabat_135_sub]
MIQSTPERQKSFSSFSYEEAFQQLGIIELPRWYIEAELSAKFKSSRGNL